MRIITAFVAFVCLAFPSLAWAQSAFQPVGGPVGGASGLAHVISTASTNSNSIKATPGTVYEVIATNSTTTLYYLKFYDKATAPICNSDTVKQTYMIPFGTSNSGGGFSIPIPVGAGFINGIGICITANAADNDNTNAATGLIVNVIYQ